MRCCRSVATLAITLTQALLSATLSEGRQVVFNVAKRKENFFSLLSEACASHSLTTVEHKALHVCQIAGSADQVLPVLAHSVCGDGVGCDGVLTQCGTQWDRLVALRKAVDCAFVGKAPPESEAPWSCFATVGDAVRGEEEEAAESLSLLCTPRSVVSGRRRPAKRPGSAMAALLEATEIASGGGTGKSLRRLDHPPALDDSPVQPSTTTVMPGVKRPAVTVPEAGSAPRRRRRRLDMKAVAESSEPL
jgi:hypothetical protein